MPSFFIYLRNILLLFLLFLGSRCLRTINVDFHIFVQLLKFPLLLLLNLNPWTENTNATTSTSASLAKADSADCLVVCPGESSCAEEKYVHFVAAA